MWTKKNLYPHGNGKNSYGQTVEEPDYSRFAKVFAIISVICILISIINFCMETLPTFQGRNCINMTLDGGLTYGMKPNYKDSFFIIESICVIWFTIEFFIRSISCPNKLAFIKNIMNIFGRDGNSSIFHHHHHSRHSGSL